MARPTLNPGKWVQHPIDGSWSRPYLFGRGMDDPERFGDTLQDEWRDKTDVEQTAEMDRRYDNWVTLKTSLVVEKTPAERVAEAVATERAAFRVYLDAQRQWLDAQQVVLDLQETEISS